MTVLFVNHTGSVSGGERSLLDLIVGLRQRQVRCVLACPSTGPLRELARERGAETVSVLTTEGSLKLHPIRTPLAIARMVVAAVRVAYLARRLGADVIHGNSIRAAIVSGLAGWMSRVASVAHLHDRLPSGRAADASLKVIGATATRIVANSEHTAESLAGAGVDREASVVYNPIDLERFRPRESAQRAGTRAQLGLSGGDVALGVVGQITPWKGQDTAIEALEKLAFRIPSARLLLVGEPKFVTASTRYDNRAFLAELKLLAARPAVAGRVDFLGERGDIPDVMSALDALLVPSWSEPFGLVVVEAMAVRTPVIATAEGGTAEIIDDGDSGLLVAPREIDAWAAAVARLVEEPGLAERLREGGARRSADFGIPAYAEAMTAVYDSARGTRGRRR